MTDAVALLQDVVADAALVDGVATGTVERERWVATVTEVRDRLDARFFDALLGIDLQAQGFEVLLRLWSVSGRFAVHVVTRCPRDDAWVPSLSEVLGGAAWHERETAEMLGIDFPGHPGLVPLLLPTGVPAHPLRKELVLARRTQTPWPGAVDPGQSEPNPRRRPLGDPGRRR